MTGIRTEKRVLCSVLWCFVLLAFIMDAAVADSRSNSSSVLPSTDGSDGSSDETTMEKGMRPFFDMVKSFLGVVQPHKLSEQSWLNLSAIIEDGKFQTEQFSNWQNWATYLIGFCVCAAVGILFFVVMPIVGLVFCCCRCAGKCGGGHKQHDPKRAGCKRKTYCTLVLLLNTVALAGVVCAFLSNELLYEKLRNEGNRGPVGKLTSALNLIDGYVNGTVDEVSATVLREFDSSSTHIVKNIQNTANSAVDDVLRILNATALLDQTKDLSLEVNHTRDELENVARNLTLLSTDGTHLANNLTAIADGVTRVCISLRNNNQGSCNNWRKEDYAVNANFSKLDRLSSESNKVAQSLDMNQYIVQAENTIAGVKQNTTNSVNDKIDDATRSIQDVRGQIVKGIDNVRSEVSTVTKTIRSFSADMQTAQKDISQYSRYGWYGGLAVSCLLLLVIVLYYLGVLFGLCGERPGLGAQCCNTGTGANFLMAGVGFTFLFAWLIMLVCLVTFVVGGPVYTEVCRYFDDHDPQELKPYETALLKAADFSKSLYKGKDVDLSVIGILDACKRDEAIYSVMKLDNMVNLTTITNLDPLRVQLDQLQRLSFKIPNVTIVSPELQSSVETFANSGLVNQSFAPYYEEVHKNLTMGDLSSMARTLKSFATLSSITNESAKAELSAYADQLTQLDDTLVHRMKIAVQELNNSLNYLDVHKNGIQVKANALITGLMAAETRFNTEKQTLVIDQLVNVINNLLEFAQSVISSILNKVRNEVGRCKPVYDGFYTVTDAGCVVVLDPLNGFWFSVGWCLFFFVPSLIFAVKLAGLYRREHDEKDFEDPNYILYGGRNQDTIPLTSRERAQAAPYPGMANSAYSRDSYLGPGEKYAPPPYGAAHNGMGSGEMTPPPYSRDRWGGPVDVHVPDNFNKQPGDGARRSPYAY